MEALQLPLWSRTSYYECVNPECFYNECQMGYDDVVWKHKWIHPDVAWVPYCPSCLQETIFWPTDDPAATMVDGEGTDLPRSGKTGMERS